MWIMSFDHDRFLAVFEQPLQAVCRRFAERRVDFFAGDLLFQLGSEIRNGAGRRRYTERHAVQLPLQVRQDKAHRLGGAGRGWYNGEGRSSCTAQVRMRAVHERLVRRVGMHRGDKAALHAEPVIEDLDHRSEAVRGATGIGQEFFRTGQGVVVDPDHDGGVYRALGGRRDDHFRSAGFNVLAGLLRRAENPGGFHNDIRSEVTPGELGGIPLRENRVCLSVHDKGVSIDMHIAWKTAMHRVVLQQVCERVGTGQVIDTDNMNVFKTTFEDRTKYEPSDASKTVDSKIDGHKVCVRFADC